MKWDANPPLSIHEIRGDPRRSGLSKAGPYVCREVALKEGAADTHPIDTGGRIVSGCSSPEMRAPTADFDGVNQPLFLGSDAAIESNCAGHLGAGTPSLRGVE